MPRCAIALLILIVAGIGAVRADDSLRDKPTPQEIVAIETCVAAAKSDLEGRACIDLIAVPCQNTQDGATTVGMSSCSSREQGAWDKILNSAYQAITSVMDETGRSEMRDIQRSWIAFRNKACGWPYLVYPGGSIASPLSADCLRLQTARRALDLHAMKVLLDER